MILQMFVLSYKNKILIIMNTKLEKVQKLEYGDIIKKFENIIFQNKILRYMSHISFIKAI